MHPPFVPDRRGSNTRYFSEKHTKDVAALTLLTAECIAEQSSHVSGGSVNVQPTPQAAVALATRDVFAADSGFDMNSSDEAITSELRASGVPAK